MTAALAQAGPPLDDFYKEVAGICFTLLGLWWVVVQLKYREGTGDPARRRHAYGILLFFLLPGVMTFVSAINGDIALLWRIAFGVSALLGIVEIVLYLTSGRIRTPAATALRVAALFLYVLLAAFAIRPLLATDLGLGLEPREVESILVGGIIVIGVHLAFLALTEPTETAGA